MNNPRPMIYIVEDDMSFRRSLVRLIRTLDFDVLAFDSANLFLSQNFTIHPACLLLDVKLPETDGFGIQQKLLEKNISLPVIFITGHGDVPMSVQAMKKGAVDFLLKPFQPEELKTAIDTALKLDAGRAEEKQEAENIRVLLDTLTSREKEVMRWVITGRLNKQIADVLGTTEKTIRVHRGRCMKKMQVTSVAQLLRLAEKAGISPAI